MQVQSICNEMLFTLNIYEFSLSFTFRATRNYGTLVFICAAIYLTNRSIFLKDKTEWVLQTIKN